MLTQVCYVFRDLGSGEKAYSTKRKKRNELNLDIFMVFNIVRFKWTLDMILDYIWF